MTKVKDLLNKKSRSKIAKQAKAGHDFGKKNVKGKTGFQAVENKAAKEYGSKEAGKRIAASIFWKMQGKK